ncbi:lysozyme inhibitor LprI family protein [Nitratifractor sp.]|uniref:lysozyme inhibitor LprI family protein n=1 Tax=Nitratifractor sp. TaxID=2268144 RepID=UPI0025F88144|nr:lysozyme inhibitor LprI family protein [Nitratifractor sp.]
MKRIMIAALVSMGVLSARGAQTASTSCWDRAMTQGAMNMCASGDFQVADKELNRIYREILKRYRKYPRFIRALKKAQKAWITMRDAQIEMAYPGYLEHPEEYGSVLPMCIANLKASLTEERIKFLKQWLNPKQEEGDVCAFWKP